MAKDIINLTDDDYKGKSFKTAPGGTYPAKISKKSAIKPGNKGNKLVVVLKLSKNKKGNGKDVNVFDHIAPHVGWKIAQLLKALGIKKKKLSLKELLKIVAGKDIRVIITEGKWKGKPQNKVVQYLPFESSGDEDGNDDDDDDDSSSDDDDDDSSNNDDDDDDSSSDDDDDSSSDDDDDDSSSDDDDDDSSSDDDDDDSSSDDDDDDSSSDDDDEEEVKPKKGKKDKKKDKEKKEKDKQKKDKKPAAKKKSGK